MKIFIIALYFILIIIFNIGFLHITVDFIGFCNLLFLNTSSFSNYNLSTWNLQYIISFYLLAILIMNLIISHANEKTSFLSMVIYRKGKKKTIYTAIKSNLFELLKYYILLNIIIVISSITMKSINVENNILYNYLILNIYLVRYFLLLFLLIMKNFINSIQNDFSVNIVKINVILLIAILIDIILNINSITFSGDIFHEISYLLFYVVIGIVYFCYKIYGGKDDRS